MRTEWQMLISRVMVVVVVAFSLAHWIATALFFAYINHQSSSCTEIGMDRCGLWSYFLPFVSLLVVSAGASAFPVIAALSAALDAGDRVCAAAFGFLLAAAAFAGYVVFSRPDHPLVTAIYGFPVIYLGSHPFAFYGSAALRVALPLIVLPYALTRGQAQRVSAATGPLLVLLLWIALRLAG